MGLLKKAIKKIKKKKPVRTAAKKAVKTIKKKKPVRTAAKKAVKTIKKKKPVRTAAKKAVKTIKKKKPVRTAAKKAVKTIKKKKPVRTAAKKAVKTIKKKKPVRTAAKKAVKTIGKATVNVVHGIKDLTSSIRNEINRFEDRTGIPAKVILSVLTRGVISPKTITYAVETSAKKGSKRFSLSKQTLDLFNEYRRKHSSFPYKANYKKFVPYHNAKLKKGTDAMTFENRIYFKVRPNEIDSEDLGLIFHEMVHCQQYYKYGLGVFIPVYVGNYLSNMVFKKQSQDKAYRNINFEKQAYTWDAKFENWLTQNKKWNHHTNKWENIKTVKAKVRHRG